MRRIFLTTILSVFCTTALAQESYELSPYFGYQTGGKIRVFDSQLVDRTIGIDIARSGVFGARFDLRNFIRDEYDLEFIFLHQRSKYEEANLLFSETPAGEFPPGEANSLDTELTSLLAGGVKKFRNLSVQERIEGGWEPYVAAAGGISYFSNFTPLPSTYMPTVSLGTGVKVFTSENFAFRLETRAFVSIPDGGKKAEVPITNRDCEGDCIRIYRYPDVFYQIDITLGFSFMLDDLRIPFVDRLRR